MSEPKALPHKHNTITEGQSADFSTAAIWGALILVTAFFGSYVPTWKWLYHSWTTSPDNSHGILVPAFSIWLLWLRRSLFPLPILPVSLNAIGLGVALLVLGITSRCFCIYTRGTTLEAASVLLCIAGVGLICGGWAAARWAWPAVLFLVFMIPIPGFAGGLLSGALQTTATISSTYFLQTIGIPAVSEGNVIWLTDKPLGVAEACSGLRMMTSFFALAVGMAIVIERPIWEKCLIILSAPMIAIVSNVLRISATAIAFEFGNEKMAELIFHDLAGWLMMPVGLSLLWAELFLCSKIFEKEDTSFRYLSR